MTASNILHTIVWISLAIICTCGAVHVWLGFCNQ